MIFGNGAAEIHGERALARRIIETPTQVSQLQVRGLPGQVALERAELAFAIADGLNLDSSRQATPREPIRHDRSADAKAREQPLIAIEQRHHQSLAFPQIEFWNR